MVSTAAGASSSISSSSTGHRESVAEERPQAGPLPSKRGEIGYSEDIHGQAQRSEDGHSVVALPARHPADRDAPPPADAAPVSDDPGALTNIPLNDSNNPSSSNPLNPPGENASTDGHGAASVADNTSTHSKRSIISFFTRRKAPKFGGMRLITLIRFTFQVLLIAGVIVAWVILAKELPKRQQKDQQSSSDSSSTSNSGNTLPIGGSATAGIFIHVAFGVATLAQFLFLERTVFRLRAERYMYKHPGEVLPRHMHREMASNPSLAFAPWNRPPLPTYAAALVESGVGTGDVEDSIIARQGPPPPAYGKTRGSTLLLAGSMTEAHRSNLMMFRRDSDVSTLRAEEGRNRVVEGGLRVSQLSDRPSRPVSYRSVDEDWNEAVDAARARALEETLATLEDSRPAPAAQRR
ncbi:hypothetical protein PUNSTDRAFT_49884 [Punctularia strigosozonata HHB-11173 SS5]|uniref:uncharacterized protein n=1 Tax=Punctularia strigosozonata (strain HHB-11173) TaxID=741275 RepID=UPI0004416A4A|nr:uncharacterized protein PUNSTDRAFT_49884 [Punctularia strigosozonata HHB-11173 SS5]EIN12570.1 hypothetical protein PUNSTDRAFT_49884 [Punctularia strigosozonata HHB-11173 SS5]